MEKNLSRRDRKIEINPINGEETGIVLKIKSGDLSLEYNNEIFNTPDVLNGRLLFDLLVLSNDFKNNWGKYRNKAFDKVSGRFLDGYDCNKFVLLTLGVLDEKDIKITKNTSTKPDYSTGSFVVKVGGLENKIVETSMLSKGVCVVEMYPNHLFVCVVSPAKEIFRIEKLGPSGPCQIVPLKHDWTNFTSYYGYDFRVCPVEHFTQNKSLKEFYINKSKI